MKPPHPLTTRLCFSIELEEDFIKLAKIDLDDSEVCEIKRLIDLGLPPITSVNSLSLMLGYNPGFTWSIINKTHKFYQSFAIAKGRSSRVINAPRVSLKLIQRWLSHHWSRAYKPSDCVHGFVLGRSHITAADIHVGSSSIFSLDIRNFFPSINEKKIKQSLSLLGYREGFGLEIATALSSRSDSLPQGAPTSPVISNICFFDIDQYCSNAATISSYKFTRYADDLVFSSVNEISAQFQSDIISHIKSHGWIIAEDKLEYKTLPNRLKVHGLLVHGDSVRLTKGYRNRLRAYNHLMEQNKLRDDDLPFIYGHLNYAKQVESFRRSAEGDATGAARPLAERAKGE